MRTLSCDVLVVGGGPAGATLAGFVKKYNPGRRVVILERERFPRHHIGESLLPGVMPILEELGVAGKIHSAGFLPKIGTVFVWGRSRKPIYNSVVTDNPDGTRSGVAWNVKRSAYDQILLDHARELGVEVLQPCAAVRVLRDESGRVRGVEARDACGPIRVESLYVADCTGQNALFDREFGVRRLNHRLKNLAVYAYYKGNPFACRYAGKPDATWAFISRAAGGWFWYIPISEDTVSVGYVSKQAEGRRKGAAELERYFQDKLRRSRELAPLLRRMERIRDFDGTGREVFAIQDYSFESRRACGNGWIAAGDATYFVDPILSTGVMLAHLVGMRAAYGLNTALASGGDGRFASVAWDDYDSFVRHVSGVFFEMALFWYERHGGPSGWQKLARRLASEGRRFTVDDLEAFNHLASGAMAYRSAIQEDQWIGNEVQSALKDLLGLRPLRGTRGPRDAGAWKPRLRCPPEFFDSSLMAPGTGRLIPARKARFFLNPARAMRDANPIAPVTPAVERALRMMDGRTRYDEIIRRAGAEQPGEIERAVAGLRLARVVG